VDRVVGGDEVECIGERANGLTFLCTGQQNEGEDGQRGRRATLGFASHAWALGETGDDPYIEDLLP
jgi:hypothetical protein